VHSSHVHGNIRGEEQLGLALSDYKSNLEDCVFSQWQRRENYIAVLS
jgi:hypothetical protein